MQHFEVTMSKLVAYFENFIEEKRNGKNFSIVFITGLSKDNMPKVSKTDGPALQPVHHCTRAIPTDDLGITWKN